MPVYFGAEGAPVIVVLHDGYGRLPWLEPYAEAVASRGFRVAVPDLFGGFCTTDAATAAELRGSLAAADALGLTDDAIADSDGDTSVVGAVGFSLGGSLALRFAQSGRTAAVVSYYASPRSATHSVIPCPVVFHWAEEDPLEPREQTDSFVARLRADGTTVTEHRYLGTEHGFANASTVARLDARAAALAFARTTVFFEKMLFA
ncbi:MAG: dienelactone hydrolase family protein [Salinibacterium sp.]|nr:dienelactone hydrolase family protein [Salinibacterium sp.]